MSYHRQEHIKSRLNDLDRMRFDFQPANIDPKQEFSAQMFDSGLPTPANSCSNCTSNSFRQVRVVLPKLAKNYPVWQTTHVATGSSGTISIQNVSVFEFILVQHACSGTNNFHSPLKSESSITARYLHHSQSRHLSKLIFLSPKSWSLMPVH